MLNHANRPAAKYLTADNRTIGVFEPPAAAEGEVR